MRPGTPKPVLPLGAMMLAGLSLTAYGETPPSAADPGLAPGQVQGDADVPQDGYQGTTTRVGKVLQSPQDVPQAVTTVTRTLMDEQKASSLREALRNVSGLTFNAAEGGRSGDNMSLRGFYTFGVMYPVGVRVSAQFNRVWVKSRADRRAARLGRHAVRPRSGWRCHQSGAQSAVPRGPGQGQCQHRHRRLLSDHRRSQQTPGRNHGAAHQCDETRRRQLAQQSRDR